MADRALSVIQPQDATLAAEAATKGDLAKLSPEDRTALYGAVCRSMGLNPLTAPFQYITLNNKLTLYATRSATDQLRKVNGISITRIEKEVVGDVLMVTAYATDKSGRTDSDIGAVAIARLQGEALANAHMKAITKAKRRVTLSIAGLGWLDETEVGSIPDAQPVAVDLETGEIHDRPAASVATHIDPPQGEAQRITERQMSLMHALRKDLRWSETELDQEAYEQFGVESLTDLSRTDASALIDDMKARLADRTDGASAAPYEPDPALDDEFRHAAHEAAHGAGTEPMRPGSDRFRANARLHAVGNEHGVSHAEISAFFRGKGLASTADATTEQLEKLTALIDGSGDAEAVAKFQGWLERQRGRGSAQGELIDLPAEDEARMRATRYTS